MRPTAGVLAGSLAMVQYRVYCSHCRNAVVILIVVVFPVVAYFISCGFSALSRHGYKVLIRFCRLLLEHCECFLQPPLRRMIWHSCNTMVDARIVATKSSFSLLFVHTVVAYPRLSVCSATAWLQCLLLSRVCRQTCPRTACAYGSELAVASAVSARVIKGRAQSTGYVLHNTC